MVNGNGRTSNAITWDTIKSALPVFLLVASIVGAYSSHSVQIERLQQEMSALCTRVDKIENKMDSLDPTLTDI